MEHIVLISKDILRCDYLPVYGNTFYSTPNIDQLAAKGTVFFRHYTAAPSTAMAVTSMFTGLYPYQTGRSQYVEVYNDDKATQTLSLFDKIDAMGYQSHLLWSNNYVKMAERYSKCFGKNTIHHNRLELNQYVGVHMPFGMSEITRDDELTERTYASLVDEIDTIDRMKPVFLWIHLPHVIAGRTGYGDDIDVLDRFLGDIWNRFGDKIYLTADHGCGNGKNGVTGYGFDLYESQIRIPLITPRIQNHDTVNFPTSNIQLIDLIANQALRKDEYVLCDTAYYAQPHRKLAVICDNYKYEYDKKQKKESLFDVAYDTEENIDLLQVLMHDKDRNRKVLTKQVLFYPYWEKANNALFHLREVKETVWIEGTMRERLVHGSWRKPIRIARKRINEIKRILANKKSK